MQSNLHGVDKNLHDVEYLADHNVLAETAALRVNLAPCP
jgi:hypothetical protein